MVYQSYKKELALFSTTRIIAINARLKERHLTLNNLNKQLEKNQRVLRRSYEYHTLNDSQASLLLR